MHAMFPLKFQNLTTILEQLCLYCKGPVNIYGNTGPGNLKRDHQLFSLLRQTGYFECRVNRVTGYFDGGFERDQRLY